MKLKNLSVTFILVAVAVYAVAAQAVTIDLVPVGNPGNAPDTQHGSYGSVGYEYQIGKFEITAGQYAEFLNAVAKTDSHVLYSPYMDYDVHPDYKGCNIKRSGTSGSYIYSVASDWANRPVNFVSWGNAARLCNWLANGQPTTGVQDLSTTEDGSYYLDGAMNDARLMEVTRKPDAIWVIPSEDEWFKAAYYDPNKPGGAGYWRYPTMSNTAPINTLIDPDPGSNANFYDFEGFGTGGYTIGGPYYRTPVGEFENSASPYGTFDQGGNVWEWNETINSGQRVIRGGDFSQGSHETLVDVRQNLDPGNEYAYLGFRVASVPEPGSITLLVCGAIAGLIWWGDVASKIRATALKVLG